MALTSTSHAGLSGGNNNQSFALLNYTSFQWKQASQKTIHQGAGLNGYVDTSCGKMYIFHVWGQQNGKNRDGTLLKFYLDLDPQTLARMQIPALDDEGRRTGIQLLLSVWLLTHTLSTSTHCLPGREKWTPSEYSCRTKATVCPFLCNLYIKDAALSPICVFCDPLQNLLTHRHLTWTLKFISVCYFVVWYLFLEHFVCMSDVSSGQQRTKEHFEMTSITYNNLVEWGKGREEKNQWIPYGVWA